MILCTSSRMVCQHFYIIKVKITDFFIQQVPAWGSFMFLENWTWLFGWLGFLFFWKFILLIVTHFSGIWRVLRDIFKKVCIWNYLGMNTILASLCSSLAIQWDTLLVLISNVSFQRTRRPSWPLAWTLIHKYKTHGKRMALSFVISTSLNGSVNFPLYNNALEKLLLNVWKRCTFWFTVLLNTFLFFLDTKEESRDGI